MSAPKPLVSVPAIALNQRDAAAALGMCADTFRLEVQPELACIRRGRLVLWPVEELQRWARDHATRTLEQRRAA